MINCIKFDRLQFQNVMDLLYVCSDHPRRYLVVFIAVQNLVEIDIGVFTVYKYYFCGFGLQIHINAPFGVYGINLTP